MANNYLITGYWGEPHVTAENDRGINAAIFGTGRFVLPVGEQFKAEYIGNNTIRMYDGKLMNNGAAAGIPAGEYIDLLISNAGQGMQRNDLIVFQYQQDASTLVEKGTFIVVQGTETDGTASDPVLTQADLLTNKASFDQMALWRVPVSGANISAPEQVFSVYKSGSTRTLLWSNDDINEIEALEVYADTTNYDGFEIAYSEDGFDITSSTGFIPNGGVAYLHSSGFYHGSSTTSIGISTRSIAFTSSSILIGYCKTSKWNGTDITTENQPDFCIPVRIYGIKGVN